MMTGVYSASVRNRIIVTLCARRRSAHLTGNRIAQEKCALGRKEAADHPTDLLCHVSRSGEKYAQSFQGETTLKTLPYYERVLKVLSRGAG